MKSKFLLILILFATSIVSYNELSAQIIGPPFVVRIPQGCPHYTASLGRTPNCNSSQWVLVFEEDFEGNHLNESRWLSEYPWGRILVDNPMKERQYYSPNNVDVTNGKIVLQTRKEQVYQKAVPYEPENKVLKDGNQNLRMFNYTSGMIFSKKKFGYGKYEIRCKIPKGKGFWPAFWTYTGDPEWNEIDIFEFWNEKNIYGNYDPSKLSKVSNFNSHYDYDGDGSSKHCGTDYDGVDYSQSYHTFTMIWDHLKIEWFIDGSLIARKTLFTTILGQEAFCHMLSAPQLVIVSKSFPREEFQHIIANLAIQAGSNSPDGSTPFPSNYEIDYIRYYQQVPCSGTETITSKQQLNLDAENYNSVVGSSISLSGVDLQQNEQLVAIAKNEISLNPGFTADGGSDFETKIFTNISCLSGKTEVQEFTFSDFGLNQVNDNTIVNSDLENKSASVVVYPNPFDSKLEFEILNSDNRYFYVTLYTMQGKIVLNSEKFSSNYYSLDASTIKSGMYLIQVKDDESNIVHSGKVIKL